MLVPPAATPAFALSLMTLFAANFFNGLKLLATTPLRCFIASFANPYVPLVTAAVDKAAYLPALYPYFTACPFALSVISSPPCPIAVL